MSEHARLSRSSSFANLLRAASTESVTSWIASLGRVPSLTRCSSSFIRHVIPDATAPLSWAESTTNIEISADDVPNFSQDFLALSSMNSDKHGQLGQAAVTGEAASSSTAAIMAHQQEQEQQQQVKQQQQQEPQVVASSAPMELKLNLDTDTRGTPKASSWTYSSALHLIFTNMDQVFPVQIQSTEPVPDNCRLHIQLQLQKDPSKPVSRCPTHFADDRSPHRAHVLQSSNSRAQYGTDEQGRTFLLVPVERTKDGGLMCQTELLKMMCFSSCSGGINRKPVSIVFSLLSGPQTLARSSVAIRVCACPTRDCRNMERHGANKPDKGTAKSTHGQETQPSKRPKVRGVTAICKRNDSDLRDTEVFNLNIKGRANYHVIRRIAEALKTNRVNVPWNRSAGAIVIPEDITQVRSVQEFLQKLTLQMYEPTFLGHGFDDMELLEHLELEDLLAMGIDDGIHQDTLLYATAKLARQPSAPYRHNLVRSDPKSQLIRVTVHKQLAAAANGNHTAAATDINRNGTSSKGDMGASNSDGNKPAADAAASHHTATPSDQQRHHHPQHQQQHGQEQHGQEQQGHEGRGGEVAPQHAQPLQQAQAQHPQQTAPVPMAPAPAQGAISHRQHMPATTLAAPTAPPSSTSASTPSSAVPTELPAMSMAQGLPTLSLPLQHHQDHR